MEQLKIVIMTKEAKLPTRGSVGSAGYDLFSSVSCIVPARGKQLVATGLCISVPNGTYGRIAPRSGLANTHYLDVGAGVIDADYRGEIGVLLFNHSNVDFIVRVGDRIAQLICEKISYPTIVEVDRLDCTERGIDGFGSTGK